jgi:hypothetical protein
MFQFRTTEMAPIRRYNRKWEEKMPWLRKADGKLEHAYCKYCNVTMESKVTTLQKHQEAKGHVAAAARHIAGGGQIDRFVKKDPPLIMSEEVKKAELELTATIVYHCSILAIDHLGDFFRRHGQGSTLEKIREKRVFQLAMPSVNKCFLLSPPPKPS